ncbi:DNA helicase-2/ATP-dependent DNA helicase PcrA [Salirhabdus euzebyi]|uniref:DNA 3'-5' helicase n=1 Tax=Salirhabdus euzebyi TaxID=394506 RepID=A0A841Q2H4_9BACI|nr:ATP-dependent helicase [Salirhabdus euzebyi]MBB6452565.1 DNA helicase-2/ATP-dependent DNA helicase PcrA [Salirhabdus euzebyi]
MHPKEAFLNRKKQEIGVSLNDVQQEAVLHTEGPLLLLAAPGSGKTTTIIMRIGYLIEVIGVDPTRIKAVTFSNASAIDMKERFARFFPTLPEVDFSTIHSLAFQVVREYFYGKQITYDIIEGNKSQWNKKMMLRNLFENANGERITEDQLDELTTYISFIKNKLMPKDKWSKVKCDVPKAEAIVKEYEDFKRNGTNTLLVDYDDMLTIANHVLENNPQMLRKYQQKYDYVLTDESQDTSLVQHAIIEKIVQRHKNLCVVADDDQSIYAWRAAEPQYLLDFKQVYPDAKILMMEQNYRSSKDIVTVANQFIKRNKNRYNKNMFTENPTDKPINLIELPDYKYQANYIVEKIQNVQDLREVAVLYRNNTSSILLMHALEKAGIPFYMKDTDNRFFSHWVVEDMLNFMRLAYNDTRADILERIYTKFNGYISKNQMYKLLLNHNNESVFDNLLKLNDRKEYQVTKIRSCKSIFRQMKSSTPLDIIRTIRLDLGYEKTIEKMSKNLGFNKDNLLTILNTLEDIADSMNTMEEFAKRLKELEALMKSSKFNKNKNAVTFSTLHSAKGLEFESVYMVDLIEGMIPSSSDIESYKDGKTEEMEEAVRLFYVGMTRAKLNLELLTYKWKYGKPVKESQFVTNVRDIMYPPSERPKKETTLKRKTFTKPIVPHNPNAIQNKEEMEVGMTVKHRVFGTGEIIQCTDESVEIRFAKTTKMLLIDTCLEKGLLEPV